MNEQYENLLANVMVNGADKGDRTGTGTRSIFGAQLRYDLQQGFPLITTKFVPFKTMATELLWMISGSTNVRWLQENNCHIWDEWADENGDLGPVYGQQWRNWHHTDSTGVAWNIDQLSLVLGQIRTNPNSRRLIVSAWNPGEVEVSALPPCHLLYQFHVADGKLSCQVYQRSCDLFLGVPFNIASYALLTHLVAQQTGLTVGDLIWTGGDCHVYNNHVDQVVEQLGRRPYPFPTLAVKPAPSLFEYALDHFDLLNYRHHPSIKADVAI